MLIGFLLPVLAIAQTPKKTQPQRVPEYTYKVIREFPHDPSAFLQGLVYHNGFFYEGTGRHGESSLRKVRMETGEVLQKRDVPGQYFGEGIVVWKNRLLELTWKAEKGFIYDLATFAPKGEFPYPGEGWGLTTDGRHIIMSDGTAQLRFWDPETLKETGRIARIRRHASTRASAEDVKKCFRYSARSD